MGPFLFLFSCLSFLPLLAQKQVAADPLKGVDTIFNRVWNKFKLGLWRQNRLQ
jgi:hypothetical protein